MSFKFIDIEDKVEKYFVDEFYPFWVNWEKVLEVFRALSFFLFALIVNFYAVRLATENATIVVGDVFFKFLPNWNTVSLDYFMSFGIYIIVFLLVIVYPKKSSKLLVYVSCIILLRSIFINLTYLGVPSDYPLQTFFTQGGDLFFSGHVALPFMVALVYWKEKILRYFFILVAVVMSLIVLVGRQHYSIDVFAAFFITHSLYSFLESYFGKDDIISGNEN